MLAASIVKVKVLGFCIWSWVTFWSMSSRWLCCAFQCQVQEPIELRGVRGTDWHIIRTVEPESETFTRWNWWNHMPDMLEMPCQLSYWIWKLWYWYDLIWNCSFGGRTGSGISHLMIDGFTIRIPVRVVWLDNRAQPSLQTQTPTCRVQVWIPDSNIFSHMKL